MAGRPRDEESLDYEAALFRMNDLCGQRVVARVCGYAASSMPHQIGFHGDELRVDVYGVRADYEHRPRKAD